jgi:hypothetical protein
MLLNDIPGMQSSQKKMEELIHYHQKMEALFVTLLEII